MLGEGYKNVSIITPASDPCPVDFPTIDLDLDGTNEPIDWHFTEDACVG